MSRARYVRALRLAFCALAALLVQGGCASLGTNDSGWTPPRPGPGGAPGSVRKRGEPVEDTPEENKGWSWSDFSYENISKTTKKLTGRGPNPSIAKQLYREADDLYKQAIAAAPERRANIFEMAAPKFRAAADRWPDSALAMDGLFMAGESYFFSDNYSQANLCYEKLIKAFPNNKYLDTVDRRKFSIARYWLEVNREHPESIFYVNWYDGTRPWKDIRGHALRIFDKIRLDDPTGKLADDATMAAGNENFLIGKYWKADEYYTDLRKAYPSSEHQFPAHFLGLKAKLNSYQGSAYGGTVLDESEKLIKQMRRQFPVDAEKEREYLDKAAAEIRYRKAERLTYLAGFHDGRGEYRAAQHYYAKVIRDFHDTPLAERATQRVEQIASLPPVPAQKLPWLVAIFPQSDKLKGVIAASEKVKQEEAAAETQLAAQPAETERR